MRFIGIAVVGLVCSCVDRAPPLPAVDPALVAENLLTAAPADIAPIGAVFDGKITYLGNTVARTKLAPGDKVVVTHYWQVNQPPGKDWKIFSHLVGSQGDFANVDQTDMRKGHTSDRWQAGQIIRDPQTFVLGKNWRSHTATLVVGLYKKGGHKISDRMPVTTGQAKDQAITVATFDVDVSLAAPLPGQIVAKKTTQPIVIDGKSDDAAWRDAAGTGAFQTAEGGPEPTGQTSAKLTWDDQNLYLFVAADDQDIVNNFTKPDDPIWKQDVIEVFIDADGNGQGYVELQVSPVNVQFDAWFPTVRPTSEVAWSSGMVTAVNVRGTVNTSDETDVGWDAEFAIPWAAVKGTNQAMAVTLPPASGDGWRINVVRADYGKDGKPTASSWNRIRMSDWHSLDRMLTVKFEAPQASAAPVATPPVESPGAATVPAAAPAKATELHVPSTANPK